MPKVSVIIPVYGVEKYIERCARSLFEQTLDDIEYLFIDDCTPDRSIEILNRVLDEYPQRKNQVIIHRMEKNSGQAAVRKWGMLNATGDYVIHCDSDDWVDVTMYEKMYNKAIEEGSDVVVCDYVVTDGDITKLLKNGYYNTSVNGFLKDMLYRKSTWALWNKLIRRELFIYIDKYPIFAMGEDMAIILQIFRAVNKLSFVKELLYYYYQNCESITRVSSKDAIISNYYQSKNNLDLVTSTWDFSGSCKQFYAGILYNQFIVKSRLLQIIQDSHAHDLYYNSYPKCDNSVIFDTNASINMRIRCLLAKLHLYRVLKKIIYNS